MEQLLPPSALDTALEGESTLLPLRAVLDASQMPHVAKSTLEQLYGRRQKQTHQQQTGGRFAQLSKLRTEDGENADEVEMDSDAGLEDDGQWEDVEDDDMDEDGDEDMSGDDESPAAIPKSMKLQDRRGGRNSKVLR